MFPKGDEYFPKLLLLYSTIKLNKFSLKRSRAKSGALTEIIRFTYKSQYKLRNVADLLNFALYTGGLSDLFENICSLEDPRNLNYWKRASLYLRHIEDKALPTGPGISILARIIIEIGI